MQLVCVGLFMKLNIFFILVLFLTLCRVVAPNVIIKCEYSGFKFVVFLNFFTWQRVKIPSIAFLYFSVCCYGILQNWWQKQILPSLFGLFKTFTNLRINDHNERGSKLHRAIVVCNETWAITIASSFRFEWKRTRLYEPRICTMLHSGMSVVNNFANIPIKHSNLLQTPGRPIDTFLIGKLVILNEFDMFYSLKKCQKFRKTSP